MATAVADIGRMITSVPEIHGGRPIVAGTDVTVRRIAIWHKLGLTPEEIAARIGHLTDAQVYAALTYYHANREALDAEVDVEDEAYEKGLREQFPSNGKIEQAGATPVGAAELFQTLARQWRNETAHLSLMLKKAMHPAYQRIIGLGPQALPLILAELQRQPGHWFWALQALTGEDPTHPGDTVTQAAQAWLEWGKERRYI